MDGAKLYKVASQILYTCMNEISLLSFMHSCILSFFLSFVLARARMRFCLSVIFWALFSTVTTCGAY